MADEYDLEALEAHYTRKYNKGPKMAGTQRGILSPMAHTPAGREQYIALSVPERLSLLQTALRTNPESLSPEDMGLLKLLRQRQEREAALKMRSSAAAPTAPAAPGLLERIFGGARQMNPFDRVADELGR